MPNNFTNIEVMLRVFVISGIILGGLLLSVMGIAYADTYQKEEAQMIWKESAYSKNSWATIMIKENDKNKKEYPNFADNFAIHVWSDTDKTGKDIQVTETGIFSGIFTANVYLKDGGTASGNSILVKQGDNIYAYYKDETLPSSAKVKTLDVSAKAKIKSNSSEISSKNSFIKAEPLVTQNKTQSTASANSECQKIQEASKKYECEKQAIVKATIDEYKNKGAKNQIGPISFYNLKPVLQKSGSKDILILKFLVENSGSKDNVSLFCTGPSVCNYVVSDGSTTYRYSGQDFVSGNIVLKPGQSKFFSMTFGPAIGYGSYVDFKFEPSKKYYFVVSEPWGSGKIPLELK